MSEEKKNQDVRELSTEEMARSNGGNIFDDIACAIVGHDWDNESQICDSDSTIIYVKYRCTRCGDRKFIKKDVKTGWEKNISEAEFEAAFPCYL